MKKMRKLLSIVMATALALTMALPASAAPVAVATPDGGFTLTIEGQSGAALPEGHDYEAYQIFAGDLATEGSKFILSNIEWGSAFDTVDGVLQNAELIAALKAKYTALGDNFTAEDVAKQLAGETDAKEFSKVVGPYVKNVAGTSVYGANEKYTISGLQPGYYLVKDATVLDGLGEGDSYSDFIIKMVGDVSASPKLGELPTPDKDVKEGDSWGDHADHAVGDIVDFRLSGTLAANYADYNLGYAYKFIDELSDGLTYNADSLYAYVLKKGQDIDNVDSYIEISTSDYVFAQNGQELTVDFANLKNIEDTAGNAIVLEYGDKIIVTYKATLNEKAVIGTDANTNTVKIEYSNNPTGTDKGTTTDIVVKVYSFELDVIKKDTADETITLAGAVFSLKNAEGKYAQATIAGDGTYKITGWVEKAPDLTTDSDAADEGTAFVSVAGGKLNIQGLDSGKEYTLTEIKAPDGYNLMDGEVKFTINATYDQDTEALTSESITVGNATEAGAEADTNTDCIVNMKVLNGKGLVLPETGGMGTTIFTVGGASLMLLAVVLLVTKKKMSNR